MATILFDGVAYGMLMFVLACGLAVTLGLMNFVNLAHGAFAMAGGYVTVTLMDRWGVPFLACLPIAFVASAVLLPGPAQAAPTPSVSLCKICCRMARLPRRIPRNGHRSCWWEKAAPRSRGLSSPRGVAGAGARS